MRPRSTSGRAAARPRRAAARPAARRPPQWAARRSRRPRGRARASPVQHRPGVRQHGRADPRLPVDDETREVARHRAAVADEQVLTGAIELESRAPPERPALVVDHHPDVRHLLERRRLQHAIVTCGQERPPARKIAGRRPEPPERAGAAQIGIALEPDRVRIRLDEVAACCRARPTPGVVRESASGSRMRSCSASSHALPCARRRPRRAARTRGSSSATRSRAAAPARRRLSLRAAPRGSAPSSTPRSRPAARAGDPTRARASGRSSASVRSPADSRSARRRAPARPRHAAA